MLDTNSRALVEKSIEEHCNHRDWKLWGQSARTNHVHVVVATGDYSPDRVRDQLKANATRVLRQNQPVWIDRPVWTSKGWIEFIDCEADLETLVNYTVEAQDRKGKDPLVERR